MAAPRRSLRSNTTISNEILASQSASMARTRKRKAAQIEKYECFTCATEKPPKQFPDFNPSTDCKHLINTCRTCLKKWVESCIENAKFKATTTGGEGEGLKAIWGVGCPQCESVMRSINVEAAVTKKVFKRFEELERNHVAETTPGWRWCLAPGCRAGQVHMSKESQPQSEEPPVKRRKHSKNHMKKAPDTATAKAAIEPLTDSIDVMTCNTCSARACVSCDRPMHDGETCTAYQARIKDRLHEEDQALKAVRKFSRPCPGCARNIQKNGGCQNMNCSQCHTNFCWNCLTKFDQAVYCKCHPRPRGD